MYDEREERRQEALQQARQAMANGEEYCQNCGKLCDSPDDIYLSETFCDYAGLLEGARSECCKADLDVEKPKWVSVLYDEFSDWWDCCELEPLEDLKALKEIIARAEEAMK